MVGEEGARGVWVEVKEGGGLGANEVVRGRGAAAWGGVSLIILWRRERKGKGLKTDPAMPIDCFICKLDFRASQYTGVILSMPSLVPTSIRVGWKTPSSSRAISFKLSSYTSAPSPET